MSRKYIANLCRAFARALTVLAVLGIVEGCSTSSRMEAVPVDRTMDAEIPGIPGARYYTHAAQPIIQAAMEGVARESSYLAKQGYEGPLPSVNFLAISGGGDNGAFGAGLIVGWTKAGDRPKFKLVTGVSTGALIAPFAFLGSEYDDQLEKIYTSISADDVFESRGIVEIPFSDAAADNAPLWDLVSQYADWDMLNAIAEEYANGRFLLIGTTNLDARRSVIWDIGAIAASGDPKALDLFHRILIASAAIPGAFPPVLIDVELDGVAHQEMHVDGGAAAQVFVYPPSISTRNAEKMGVQRDRTLYVIRNARLDPDWASVEPHIFSIVARAISSLIQTQGVGDLNTIYHTAKRDGVDYNLAYISSDFTHVHEEAFDTAFMQALFDYAYGLASAGYQWAKYPPDFAPIE